MTGVHGPHHVPYDEFLVIEKASEERHEWVDGVVYAMSRGSPEHGRLTGRVIARMLTPLLEDGCEIFSGDTAIFIEAARHHTYADASIVCGSLVTRTVHDKNGQSIGEAIVNPTVIVEVLSDATERYDRDGKFEAYKKLSSLEEYVLVSQSEPRIEVRSLQGQVWTATFAGRGETIAELAALADDPSLVDALDAIVERARGTASPPPETKGTESAQVTPEETSKEPSAQELTWPLVIAAQTKKGAPLARDASPLRAGYVR